MGGDKFGKKIFGQPVVYFLLCNALSFKLLRGCEKCFSLHPQEEHFILCLRNCVSLQTPMTENFLPQMLKAEIKHFIGLVVKKS